MGKFKRLASLALLGLVAPAASALETDVLWLPKSYQGLYLNLVEAAEAAEALERCVSVLEGTLDRQQSQPEHPIYRILCRQDNGRSYNEMVDGLTLNTLTTQESVEEELSAEALERIEREEQARREAERQRRQAALWQSCHAALINRTSMMIDREWVSDPEPEPQTFDGEVAVFLVDFNAQSVWGKALEYRARCRADTAGNLDLKLLKRPQ